MVLFGGFRRLVGHAKYETIAKSEMVGNRWHAGLTVCWRQLTRMLENGLLPTFQKIIFSLNYIAYNLNTVLLMGIKLRLVLVYTFVVRSNT